MVASMSAPISIKQGVRLKKPGILIADDDPTIVALLRTSLGNRYRLVECADGHAAVAAASKNQRIALCILDIIMPGMNGLRLAGQLRAMPHIQRCR